MQASDSALITPVLVTIIIPAWRRADLLRECLRSIGRQSERRFRVVVVSNGGGAEVQAAAREFSAGHDCKLVSLPENRGFAAGVNAGLQAAGTPYVAVLNDDVRLDSDWLRTLTGWLAAHPEAGFCTGMILSGDGTRVDNLGDAVARSLAAWRLGFGAPANAADNPADNFAPRPLLAASWTAIVLRASTIQQVGKLDEEFISYLEDVDFAVRCVRANVSGYFLPQARCWHAGGASSGAADSPFVFRQMTRNHLLLLAKTVPFRVQLANWFPLCVDFWLWLLMAIRKGRLGAWFRGQFSYGWAMLAAKRKRLQWDAQSTARLAQWVQAGEAAIYDDQFGAYRPTPDTYWRWYFRIVGVPRRLASPAAPPAAISETTSRQP